MKTKGRVDVIECHACHLQVLGRGGDLENWKAVQLDPQVPELRWFCMKPVCQQVYTSSLQEAQLIWAGGELEEPEPPKARPKPKPLPPPEPPKPPPPGELVAYETADPQEMGWRDEVVAGDKAQYMRFEDEPGPCAPSDSPEALPVEHRYIPKPSAVSTAKFVRHEGTGEDE